MVLRLEQMGEMSMAILVSGEQQHHEKLENNRVISQVLTSTSNFKVKNVEGIFFPLGCPHGRWKRVFSWKEIST